MVENPNNDKIIVKDCLRGNSTAQKALFEKYKTGMYTIAFRILGNSDDAHDALQETFINVFTHLSDFSFKSTLGSWIKRITINSSLQILKKQNRFELKPEEAAVNKTLGWKDDFTAEMLDKAIRSLPDKARIVFLLIEVEGYKHQEVAEMTGIKVGTSKSQLFYAKTLLQKKLMELKNND
jgi:RNA polymerase sigma factor (sigma-70 family)